MTDRVVPSPTKPEPQTPEQFYYSPWMWSDEYGRMWQHDSNKAVFQFAEDFAKHYAAARMLADYKAERRIHDFYLCGVPRRRVAMLPRWFPFNIAIDYSLAAQIECVKMLREYGERLAKESRTGRRIIACQ